METNVLDETAERLVKAATQFEQVLVAMKQEQQGVCGEVHKIIATADEQTEAERGELERKLQAAEQRIAALEAQAEAARTASSLGRKTLVAEPVQMLSKGGVASNVEAGALDAALSGLSLEQRIAVKAQLLRSGMLS